MRTHRCLSKSTCLCRPHPLGYNIKLSRLCWCRHSYLHCGEMTPDLDVQILQSLSLSLQTIRNRLTKHIGAQDPCLAFSRGRLSPILDRRVAQTPVRSLCQAGVSCRAAAPLYSISNSHQSKRVRKPRHLREGKSAELSSEHGHNAVLWRQGQGALWSLKGALWGASGSTMEPQGQNLQGGSWRFSLMNRTDFNT